MAKRPWMPFYLDDFTLDTLDLSADEIGVYITMICLAWRRGDGSITGDMDELKRVLKRCFADFHGHTFNRIVPKLLERYFELRDGRWFQKRVVFELERAEKLSERQSEIARKRWKKSGQTRGIRAANGPQTVRKIRTNAEQTETKSEPDSKENNDLVDAMAMPACARHPHTQSHLREEREERRLNTMSVSKPKPTRYSEDFETFWKAYPTSPTMSKKQAGDCWKKLGPEDRVAAASAIKPYRDWLAQKSDRPVVHACRFLSQRRFDGFNAPPGDGDFVNGMSRWLWEAGEAKRKELENEQQRRNGHDHQEKLLAPGLEVRREELPDAEKRTVHDQARH